MCLMTLTTWYALYTPKLHELDVLITEPGLRMRHSGGFHEVPPNPMLDRFHRQNGALWRLPAFPRHVSPVSRDPS